MKAQQAKEEAQKILQRTIPVSIRNTQEGYEARAAIYGFRNEKIFDQVSGKRKVIREIVPEEALLIRKMYELINQGVDTPAVCEAVNEMGFRTKIRNRWNSEHTEIIGKLGGKKLTPKHLWELVENVSYAGFKQEMWTRQQLIKAKHAHIIPIDLWNNANKKKYKIVENEVSPTGWTLLDVRDGEKRSYLKQRPEFPFKNLICCPECGKTLKASSSRGKTGKYFPAYHCDRGHKRVSINPTELESILSSFLERLKFKKPLANLLELTLNEIWLRRLKELNSGILTKAERVVELRQKADGIFEKISVLSNPLLIKRSEEEYDNIIKEVALLESKKNEKEYSEQDVIRVVKTARRFVEHLDELVLEANDEPTLRVFWEMIFPTLPNLEELKNGTPQISPILELKQDLEKPENVMAWQRDNG